MASDTRRSDQCRRSCHCIWCPEWTGRDVSRRFSPGQRIAVDRYTYSNFIELAQLYHLEIVPIGYDSRDGPRAFTARMQKKNTWYFLNARM